jgi:hypothetical protein
MSDTEVTVPALWQRFCAGDHNLSTVTGGPGGWRCIFHIDRLYHISGG